MHYDFNRSIILSLIDYDQIFLVTKQLGLREVSDNITVINFSGVLQKVVQARKMEVIYLTLTKKDILYAGLLQIFSNVSFIIHKYNLFSYRKSFTARIAYKALSSIKVTPLRLDLKPQYFIDSQLFPRNIFEALAKERKSLEQRNIGRIILIGEASREKNLGGLLEYLEKHDLDCLHVVDIQSTNSLFETCNFDKFIPQSGDAIWGCYDKSDYRGIKSGLPFAAIKFKLPILVTDFQGFIFFRKVFPNYLRVISDDP